MSEARTALGGLLETSTEAGLLRKMIGFAAERLMEPEAQGVTRAGHGERPADRLVQRDGWRDRDGHPGTGDLTQSRHSNGLSSPRRVTHGQCCRFRRLRAGGRDARG